MKDAEIPYPAKAVPARDEKGRILPGQSLNPAGRTPGRTPLERIRSMAEPHVEAAIACLAKAVTQPGSVDSAAVRAAEALVERVSAKPKPAPRAVQIPGLKQAEGLEAKAKCILDAGADGLLAPEEVRSWLATLADVARVLAFDDHEQRLARLEGRLEGRAPRVVEPAGKPAAVVEAEVVDDPERAAEELV